MEQRDTENNMRARNIKPGFFRNEELGELEPVTRLFFIGLWCYADREGRFEDRPKRLRAELMPYDNADGEEMMVQLARAGMIERYEYAGEHYAQIVNFTKHQSPYGREQDSTIPDKDGKCLVHVRDKNGACTGDVRSLFLDSLDPSIPLITVKEKPIEEGEPKRKRFVPPAVSDCIAYGKEIGLSETECTKFHDFQTSKGWKVGTAPMKDWKASMRTWMRNAPRFAPSKQKPAYGSNDMKEID